MSYANVKEMWYSTHDPDTEPEEETLWLCDPHEQDDHEWLKPCDISHFTRHLTPATNQLPGEKMKKKMKIGIGN